MQHDEFRCQKDLAAWSVEGYRKNTRSSTKSALFASRVGVDWAVHLLDAVRIAFLHERNQKYLSGRKISKNRQSLRLKPEELSCGIGRIDDCHKIRNFLKTVHTDGSHISRPHLPGHRQLVGHLRTVAYLAATLRGNRWRITEPH